MVRCGVVDWHFLSLLIILFSGHKSIQARYIKTASLSGRDHPTCGTTWKKACATLPGALQVAENHDVIELDGTGTSLHPYDCKLQPLEISINVNITSSNTSRANISCPMINIKSSHPTTSNITVNFTRLTLTNTPIVINDSSIVLQDVIVTKTSRYAIRGRYDLLDVTPYVTLLKSTFEDNEGKMLSFDFGGSPGISRGDAFIIKDTTFKKNKAENTSLLEISLSGLNVYSDLKVCFTNLTMDSNVAFRGVYVFSEVTNMTTRVSILDSLSKNNDWEWSGIHVQSNNSLNSEVEISRSTFLSNQGVDIGSGPGSCIYIDIENGPGSVVLSDLKFEEHKAKMVGKPVAVKYGCVHIEFDGDSTAKVKNLTSINGKISAILYRFEQQNNTLEVINSTFMGLEAAFGAGVLLESWTCKVRQGIYSCFYDTSEHHEVDARFVNCNFFNNRATNKGGAACIAPDSSFKGNLSFFDCNFRNNFASDEGGHIFVGGSKVETIFQNTILHQTTPDHPDQASDGKNMLCYTNNGKVTMINSTIDSDTRGNIQSLVKIVGLRSFEVEGGMKITCPTGTSVELHNSSFATLLPESRESYFTTVLIWSCKSCGYGLYSPSRGSWSNREPGLHRICYKCPLHGADCGEDENLVATKNWWCSNTSTNDEVSCFHCLEDRCCPMPKGKDLPNPKEYNNCCGNRTGILCGKCKDGFAESWFGSQCEPYDSSNKGKWWVSIFFLSLSFAVFIVYSINDGFIGLSCSCEAYSCCSGDSQSNCCGCSGCLKCLKKCGNCLWRVIGCFKNCFVVFKALMKKVFACLVFLFPCIRPPIALPNPMECTHSFVSGYQWLGVIIEESPINIASWPVSLVKGTAKVFSASIPFVQGLGVNLWEKATAPFFVFWISLLCAIIIVYILPFVIKFLCFLWKQIKEKLSCEDNPKVEASSSSTDSPVGATSSTRNPEEGTPCEICVKSKFCQILKEILSYLLLPLVSMILKLIIPIKINDKCYNMFAPEGQSSIWKLQSKLSWLCIGDSNGLPFIILIIGLFILYGSEHFKKSNKQVQNDASTADPNRVSNSNKKNDKIEFHRNFWRNFVNCLIAFIGVCVVEPSLKQASIIICLFALFVRIYRSSDGPPIKPELIFELFVIAFSAFVSLLTIGTHKCNSENGNLINDFSLACFFHNLRFLVLIPLFFVSIIAVGLCLIDRFFRFLKKHLQPKCRKCCPFCQSVVAKPTETVAIIEGAG